MAGDGQWLASSDFDMASSRPVLKKYRALTGGISSEAFLVSDRLLIPLSSATNPFKGFDMSYTFIFHRSAKNAPLI